MTKDKIECWLNDKQMVDVETKDKKISTRIEVDVSPIEMGDTQGQSEPMRTGFYLYVPDADAVYAQAVAAGATPLAAPTDQSYGDRMGSVMDAQGITWFIAQPA